MTTNAMKTYAEWKNNSTILKLSTRREYLASCPGRFTPLPNGQEAE
jgi:hypothetical protein